MWFLKALLFAIVVTCGFWFVIFTIAGYALVKGWG
jgi:hypothetical protein